MNFSPITIMINTIIFDLGDVFINLEKEKTKFAFQQLGLLDFDLHFEKLNQDFEIGKISENTFLCGIQQQIPGVDLVEIKAAWNCVIGEFPIYRLNFLIKIAQTHKLFLLSNTDAIHIDFFEKKMGKAFVEAFYNCFEKVYFSFQIKHRKPDIAAFEFVIWDNNLDINGTLFVDDNDKNIAAAAKIGLKTWHLIVGSQDVVDLILE